MGRPEGRARTMISPGSGRLASKRATLAEATFGTPPILDVIVGWAGEENADFKSHVFKTMFEVAI